MAPRSGTTATTAGPAFAPLSPRDAWGGHSRSVRSGSWRRQRPRAASADIGPSTRGPAPAEETAPAAQAASPAAPPPEGAPARTGG